MRTLLFSAAIAIASLGCSDKSKDSSSKVQHDLPELTVDEVAAGLEAKQLTVYDCNSDKTRNRIGILPGAVLIDDEEAYAPSVLPANKAAKIVFYCGGPG